MRTFFLLSLFCLGAAIAYETHAAVREEDGISPTKSTHLLVGLYLGFFAVLAAWQIILIRNVVIDPGCPTKCTMSSNELDLSQISVDSALSHVSRSIQQPKIIVSS